MASDAVLTENPYIGPRAFTERQSDLFFGRRRESRELLSLVIARRGVLLYAQSGAGKTSLLQASLIPELRKRGRVASFPIARVTGGADPASRNLYVTNALAALLPDCAAGATLTEAFGAALATVDDDDGTAGRPRLMILDQFEEIFTFHPELVDQRKAFFAELGDCLEAHPQLSLLLSMREDYLADLDAHVAPLPDRMRTRMRMERLKRENALEAIRGPAAQAGMPFADGAAEILADNLRQLRTGAVGEAVALGPYVEPVQLQIVCRQLWAGLAGEEGRTRTQIDQPDIEAHANVDNALIDFYRASLAEAETKTGVTERALREWFDTRLITPAGTRGLVFRGPTETEGLPNAAVDSLRDSYLIRADLRGGQPWYELTHDRLVEPILDDNSAWRARYHNPVADALRRDIVLNGTALAEARAFAKDHPADLKPEERAFLDRCVRNDRVRRTALIAGATALTVVAIALSGLTWWALSSAMDAKHNEATAQRNAGIAAANANRATVALAEADRQRKMALASADTAKAESIEAGKQKNLAQVNAITAETNAEEANARRLLSASQLTAASDNELSMLLAVEGARIKPDPDFASRLQQGLFMRGQTLHTLRLGGEVEDASWSPSREWIIAADEQLGGARLIDAHTLKVVDTCDDQSGEGFVTWEPGVIPERVVVGGTWRGAVVYRIDHGHCVLDDSVRIPREGARHMAWAPDGRRLLAGSPAGNLTVTDIRDGKTLRIASIPAAEQTTEVAAWSPNGGQIVAIAKTGVGLVLDAKTGAVRAELKGHKKAIEAVAWGTRDEIATASQDGTVRIWGSHGDAKQTLPMPRGVTATFVDWSPNGRYLAASLNDGTVSVWSSDGEFIADLRGHSGPVEKARWSADSRNVISSGKDGQLRIWDPFREDFIFEVDEPPGKDPVRASWNFDNTEVALGGPHSGVVRVWRVDDHKLLFDVSAHTGGVKTLVWSRDGRRLLTTGEDDHARIWDAGSGKRIVDISDPEGAQGERTMTLAAWSPDDKRIFTVSESIGEPGGEVRLLSDNGVPSKTAPLQTDGAITWAAWDPTGRRIVATMTNTPPWALIWTPDTGETIPLEGHTDLVWHADWSPDGRHVVTAGNDGKALIWDTATGQMVKTLGPAQRYAAWSHSGSRVVTVSEDKTASIWDMDPNHQKPLVVFKGHHAEVRFAAWSPNDRLIVTAAAENVPIVWDTATGAVVNRLEGHSRPVRWAAWNRDGTRVLTVSDDVTARVWLLRLPDLIDAVCKRTSRNMTRQEWATYMGAVPYHRTCSNLSAPD